MSETQSMSPPIAAARAALASVLASEPDDLDVRLAVATALSQIEDVQPPYPPLEYPAMGKQVEVAVHVRAAHQSLKAAIGSAPSVAQAVSWAAAARTLVTLLDMRSA